MQNPHIHTSNLVQFVLLPFIHLPIVATPLARLSHRSHSFQVFFVVFLHDAPDIGPPLDPALCAVHYFFLPCATTATRCSTLPRPPHYSVHIHIHSIIWVHISPSGLLQAPTKHYTNMLSSTSALLCPLQASQASCSCRTVLLNNPKTV